MQADLDALSFEPLTPLRFLDRAASVFGGQVAVVDGGVRRTYRELHVRCRRFAGALRELGVEPGDRVAVLAANSPLLLEAHYGVPGCGAVLVALNYRLSAGELAAIIKHSGAHLLLFDGELAELAADTVELAGWPPMALSDTEFEQQLAGAATLDQPHVDERSLISINYTSGTTGTPKGVMYHHRGAYLQALAMALHAGWTRAACILWTLPMFHCNGWCFTWARDRRRRGAMCACASSSRRSCGI